MPRLELRRQRPLFRPRRPHPQTKDFETPPSPRDLHVKAGAQQPREERVGEAVEGDVRVPGLRGQADGEQVDVLPALAHRGGDR